MSLTYRTRLPLRSVWLVQLPIPPLGSEPIRGNVPLAAAYLKLWAEKRGLGSFYDIQLLPTAEANTLGDRALAAALAEREPWLVGFTCYVWNVERTLWIARELKRLRPEVRIQSRPPYYYVLQTPTLIAGDIIGLMEEAQELFELEFDAPLLPLLMVGDSDGLHRTWHVDLDVPAEVAPPARQAQAFTLWLRSSNFARQRTTIVSLLRRLLRDNPFTTLQIVLDPKNSDALAVRSSLDPELTAVLLAACHEQPTYLDKYYAMHPGLPRGARRLIVLLPFALRTQLPASWLTSWSEHASLVWRDGDAADFETHEFT